MHPRRLPSPVSPSVPGCTWQMIPRHPHSAMLSDIADQCAMIPRSGQRRTCITSRTITSAFTPSDRPGTGVLLATSLKTLRDMCNKLKAVAICVFEGNLALIESSFRRMRSDIAMIATKIVYVEVGGRWCCYRTDQWGVGTQRRCERPWVEEGTRTQQTNQKGPHERAHEHKQVSTKNYFKFDAVITA
jgi:hypothetical protein